MFEKVNNMELKYFTKLSFAIMLPEYQGGRESIYSAFVNLLEKQEQKAVLIKYKYSQTKKDDEAISIKYQGMPFANLFFVEEILIKDNSMTYSYEEKVSDHLMLPNIYSYIMMTMMMVKMAEFLSGAFEKFTVDCNVTISNNGETFFYEKYSPLKVDFSWIHKYRIGPDVYFNYSLKNIGDCYVLINKIYQQYQTSLSIDKAFVTVDKADFYKLYGEL